MDAKTIKQITGLSRQSVHRQKLAGLTNDELLTKSRVLIEKLNAQIETHKEARAGYVALVDVLQSN